MCCHKRIPMLTTFAYFATYIAEDKASEQFLFDRLEDKTKGQIRGNPEYSSPLNALQIGLQGRGRLGHWKPGPCYTQLSGIPWT